MSEPKEVGSEWEHVPFVVRIPKGTVGIKLEIDVYRDRKLTSATRTLSSDEIREGFALGEDVILSDDVFFLTGEEDTE